MAQWAARQSGSGAYPYAFELETEAGMKKSRVRFRITKQSLRNCVLTVSWRWHI
jgi:hypothetical protein